MSALVLEIIEKSPNLIEEQRIVLIDEVIVVLVVVAVLSRGGRFRLIRQ